MPGDLWRAAVAATHTGLQPVLDAKAVPAAAKTYVDTASSYAEWYARQSQFVSGTAPANRAAAPYRGHTCPGVVADVSAGRVGGGVNRPGWPKLRRPLL